MASLIDALMEAQAGMNQQFGQYAQQTQEATKVISDSASSSAQVKTEVEAQKLKDDNAAINVGKVLAKALGADPNAANYRMEKLSATKAQATDEALAATEEYEQLSQVGFLDNPIEWLLAQFQKDSVAEKANAATQTSLLATQEINDINQQIQQGVMTSKIVSETVNEDITAKKLELASAANKQAAEELKLKGINANVDALKAVMSGNQALISAAAHQDSVILQHQSMAQAERHFQANQSMAEKRYKLDVEQFNAAQAQREIANDFKQQSMDFAQTKWDAKQEADANKLILDLEDRAAKADKAGNKAEAKKIRDELTTTKKQLELDKALAVQEGKKDLVARYKQVVASIGAENLIAIPDNIYDAEKVIMEGSKLAKNPQDAYGVAWKAVRDSMASVVQQAKVAPDKHPVVAFGFTPLEAVTNMQVLNPKLEPAQARTAKAVQDKIQQEIQAIKKDDANISNKELKAEVDYRVAKHFTEAMMNPESSDLTKLPKPAELANFATAKKGGKFFSKYLAPKIAEGNLDTSFEEISSLAEKALTSKDVNMNELAKELSGLYSEAITYNNAKQGYSRFGIPMMNSYMIRGIGERELDMTNPTDVKTALIYQITRSGPIGSVLHGIAPSATDWFASKLVESRNPEDATRR
jgi:hypothetical protein